MGTTEATLRMENLEVRDEWQDEDFPRPLPEDGDSDGLTDNRTSPPAFPHGDHGGSSAQGKRRVLMAPDIHLSLEQSEGSVLSDDLFLDTPDDLDINVDDMETPDDTDSLEFIANGNELEWEDDTLVACAKGAPGDGSGRAGDEGDGGAGRLWRTVIIGEKEQQVDMQVIRPYLRVVTHGGGWCTIRVIGSSGHQAVPACGHSRRWVVHDSGHRVIGSSGRTCVWSLTEVGGARFGSSGHRVIRQYLRVVTHGGYYGEGLNAVIVFAACYLPDSSCQDYHYIMENLFLYVVSSLEMLVAEDYMIVYLNGATPRRRMPGIGWLKRCYQMIDRKLRKNLKCLIIAHPSWFIRTVLAVSRPFISVKFLDKVRYVQSLEELAQMVPMEHVQIPECVLQ
ncbi:hypothetical protein P4O66_014691 [Electrophorus voltai]|uniref:CRAL-TRIO domain-containing protein n=1 Tax=Electrophorus voltai TaxID=2609070 RepID=A0AAD9DRS7_9TELE|nr:hypothetical protein P4O66_014691 [Electrophorus voltai]